MGSSATLRMMRCVCDPAAVSEELRPEHVTLAARGHAVAPLLTHTVLVDAQVTLVGESEAALVGVDVRPGGELEPDG